MFKLFSVFIMMSSLAYAQVPEEPERYFDFWVGEWEASWSEGDGKVGKGTNRIEKILDGKVLKESFEITEGQSVGFKGTSISVYQAAQKTWKQSWADNQSTFYYFEGALSGENRIFQTKVYPAADGRQLTQRMVFKDIRKNSMTWDWESSSDGGRSWTLSWRIEYQRKP